jgi:protein TonB
MKKGILFGCFIVLAFAVNAQADTAKINTKDTDIVFTSVQNEAYFPGAGKGWVEYLQNNLNTSLGARYLRPKKGETITQVAIISFIIDKKGKVSQVSIDNPKDVHPKLAAESIRVIQNSPLWIPATQNDKIVISRKKQPITWEVTGD